MTPEQMIGWINQASLADLVLKFRNEPGESLWLFGDVGKALSNRMDELRGRQKYMDALTRVGDVK